VARGAGSIFFTGATASLRGGVGYAAFASAKAGLRALAQAMAAHESVGGNIVVVEPAAPGEAHKYGVVALGATAEGFDGRLKAMTGMVEKPTPGTEPSNLFISGRYILQPGIFDLLNAHRTGAGGEIQLTDAMLWLLADEPFHALEYAGVTYDCGDKLGLLRANLAFALKDPGGGEEVRAMAESLLAANPARPLPEEGDREGVDGQGGNLGARRSFP